MYFACLNSAYFGQVSKWYGANIGVFEIYLLS